MDRFVLKPVSSLEKIFHSTDPDRLDGLEAISCLQNETVSFQLVYRYESEDTADVSGRACRLTVESDMHRDVTIRNVELVPAGMPHYYGDRHPTSRDDYILDDAVGMYPDLLGDCNGIVIYVPRRSKSCWVTIEDTGRLAAGAYTLRFTACELAGKTAASAEVRLTVIDAELPPQTVYHTEWFHVDCLADYYRVTPYSAEHWRIIENFVRLAAKRSINTLLVPVFTPSLDIAEGFERTDVQLLAITVQAGTYRFDFSRVKRYLDLCRGCGIEYFEISPLFSQWGARFAPTVYAAVDGVYRCVFGWETPADSTEYREFLDALLPQLTAFLSDEGIADRVFFHISDEPPVNAVESYQTASRIVEPYLRGSRTIDALSDLELYQRGLVQTPVSASDHIAPFLGAGVHPLWVYYCCAQNVDVANRFLAMPSARSRIIGVQLYKYAIEGFLHWGYNFYNSQKSLRTINPYLCTDGDFGFPAGDPFVVYPDIDGTPLDSLRLMVINEAFEDIRAFQLLESLSDKDHVMALIEAGIEPITFSTYPRHPGYFIDLRARVHREIARLLAAAR